MIKQLIIILLLSSQINLYPMKTIPKYLNQNTPSYSLSDFKEKINKPVSYKPPSLDKKDIDNINSIKDDIIIKAREAKERGFNNNQVAALLGNLYHESKLNPEQKQHKGPGRGLSQYEKGSSRYKYMMEKANINQQDPKDSSFQFNHILDEMLHPDSTVISDAWLGRKNQREFIDEKDLNKATKLISTKFLRPGKPQLDKRQKYAEYMKYLMNISGI